MMRKMVMKRGVIQIIAVCFLIIFGIVPVSAEEPMPVIAIGKDVTVTYTPDNYMNFILFYPNNTGNKWYRITGTIIDASSDTPFILASANRGGASNGSGIYNKDNFRKSNPKCVFETSMFKKDGDDLNGLHVTAVFPSEENDNSDAFITVEWHIESLIGLNDSDVDTNITLSQKTLYYDGKGNKPYPTVISVTVNGKKLQEGKDYLVDEPWYENDTNGGMTITGIGAYGGFYNISFKLTSQKEDVKKTDTGKGGQTINSKKAQPMTVKSSTKTIKAKSLKKKSQTIKPITVKSAQGTVSYKISGGNKKSKKALKINEKTGKVTVKKGTKKGTYKVKVTVTAAGNAQYNSGSKSVDVSVKVK